ncbi:MAG: DUF1993 domain-containing protein [Moraxellaceae bacterium]|nr:MAG: DUF1993 domain-containing protein [Moraxellaceae bacterium]
MKNKHIEIFVEYLGLLVQLIDKVEHASNGNEEILRARLAPDMFPFAVQAEIVASFALRSCCPIAGVEVVSFSQPKKSFAALRSQLYETIEHIVSLDNLDNDLSVMIEDKAGPVPVVLEAEEFLVRFSYPNFYFHLSMVYAIARSKGIPLTKGDFDGIHQYPPGFSFEGAAHNKEN